MEAVAGVMRSLLADFEVEQGGRDFHAQAVARFVDLFTEDNPRFLPSRFVAACHK